MPVGEPDEAQARASASKRRVELVQTKETITAKGDGFEWVISRETGQIIKATRNGRTVLVGGPVLMVLTTKGYGGLIPGFPTASSRIVQPFERHVQRLEGYLRVG